MTFIDPLFLIPAAFLAGVLMFLAPCTLPLVPGYLAFIAGGGGRVVRNAFAFVLGFSIVFVLLGTFAGLFGAFITPWRDILVRVAGAFFVFFGLTMLGAQVPLLSRTRAMALPAWLTVGRPESSVLIGILFALGWSPCIGPILGAILFYASVSATALSGALLLLVFALGFSIPFLLSALFIERAGDLFTRWEKAVHYLSTFGALVFIALGVLMLTNTMGLLITWGYSLFDFIGYEQLLQYL